jgi:hypothetical protein
MNLTRWIIVGVVAITGLIDIVLAIFGGMQATISFNITQWSHTYPAIPFAFGFLMGHFFAQNKM